MRMTTTMAVRSSISLWTSTKADCEAMTEVPHQDLTALAAANRISGPLKREVMMLRRGI